MTNLLRMLILVATLVVVVLAAVVEQPECVRDLGFDPQTVAALRDDPIGNARLDHKIREQEQAIQRRYLAKKEICKQVMDGQITLFEAAIQFRHWNNEYPALPDDPSWLGDSEEERLCRQVIRWVRTTLIENPGAGSEDLVRHLEEVLRRNKECHGRVRLQ